MHKYHNKAVDLIHCRCCYVQMKETLDDADLEHKKTLTRMEQKFLNDKVYRK